ncbi:hypothetical protein QEZ54_27805 [Catellatospora sp. KI3]|uniref:hypothetical protein n=1 Tax=Catellatospora sp. KI3 TaxID=3041620 RepID=UPI0024832C91|nr:hypothetical protein [Catellatospora sp. KI3]MDI1464782.1 hypothetical protein [Catellatospora sp. KI3]
MVQVLLRAFARAGVVVTLHPQIAQVPAGREHLRLLLGRQGAIQMVMTAGPLQGGMNAGALSTILRTEPLQSAPDAR